MILLLSVMTSFPILSTSLLVLPLDCLHQLWSYSKILSFLFLALAFLASSLFEDLCWLLSAVARNVTQRRLQRVWLHKECFDVWRPKAGDNEEEDASRSLFQH
jgi:hypothetical protein